MDKIITSNNSIVISHVVLQATPLCNLRCTYCYLSEESRATRARMPTVMPADAINYVINTDKAAKNLNILWHAGEPLAAGIQFYQEAIENIDRILPTRYSVVHTIQTNATLINESWCEFFKAYDFKIGISVDGPDFLHDKNRLTIKGNGTHIQVEKGIKLLKKHNISFSAIAVITAESLSYPDEIYNYFRTLGVSVLGMNIEEIESANLSSSAGEKHFFKNYEVFLARLFELQRLDKEPLFIREIDINLMNIKYGKGDVGNLLVKPFHMFNVDYQGNFSTFSPEMMGAPSTYGSFYLGNIYKDTLDEVLQSQKYKMIMKHIEFGVKKCKDTCAYFFLCGGGAPVNKLYENGGFDTTETLYCKSGVKIPVNVILPILLSSSDT